MEAKNENLERKFATITNKSSLKHTQKGSEEFDVKNAPIRKGLVNVVVDTTKISFTNGETGECCYRGYQLEDLFQNSTFEEVAFLLIFGHLPTQFELSSFKESLIRERDIPDRILMILKSFPRRTTRIELLRTAVSALSLYDKENYDYSPQANIRKGIRIIAKIPTILAFSHRIQSNLPLVEPSKTLGHASNFYYMLTGNTPTPEIAEIFDKLLICHAEHDINASTFTARVTVSTLSDIYSGVVSAIGALRGPLHGGANERVIRYFLEEIKTPDNVIPWAKQKLAKKERIMGFGHRVYRTYDPRGILLKPLTKKAWKSFLKENPEHPDFYAMALELEKFIYAEKGINPNVDFISAILLYAIGIDPFMYTPIFAISRCVGWITHAMEQIQDNKLIRPRLHYCGEVNKEYRPMDNR